MVFSDPDADPDYQLVWPRELFVAELTEVRQLFGTVSGHVEEVLREAFAGPAPAEDLRRPVPWLPSVPVTDPWSTSTPLPAMPSKESRHLDFLVEHVDEIPLYRPPKDYWGARRSLHAADIGGRAARIEWTTFADGLVERGYLARGVPEECVDGNALGPREERINEEIARRLGPGDWYPFVGAEEWSDDHFYGLIEVFHDLVARPRSRSYHDYGDCGWHYTDFAIRPARVLYRRRVNDLLGKNGLPVRLASVGEDVGRLVTDSNESREELITAVLSSPEDGGTKAHAIAMFRSRTATVAEKRSACIALAGLIEQRRDLVKEQLLSKDEGMLFQLMNQYAIRHQRADQHGDYDVSYLDWVFWNFLAAVELVDRLVERAGADPAP